MKENCSEILNQKLEKYNSSLSIFKKTKTKKIITFLIFLILPKRYLKLYLALSFLAIIHRVKNTPFSLSSIENQEKINHLLGVKLSEEILLIPNNTCCWVWDERLLNEILFTSENKVYRIRDVLLDNELFFKKRHSILKIFIEELPFVFKFKLGLNNKKNTLEFENFLTRNFVYSFTYN